MDVKERSEMNEKWYHQFSFIFLQFLGFVALPIQPLHLAEVFEKLTAISFKMRKCR